MAFRLNILPVPVGYVQLGGTGRFLRLIEFFLAVLILDIGSEGGPRGRTPAATEEIGHVE